MMRACVTYLCAGKYCANPKIFMSVYGHSAKCRGQGVLACITYFNFTEFAVYNGETHDHQSPFTVKYTEDNALQWLLVISWLFDSVLSTNTYSMTV